MPFKVRAGWEGVPGSTADALTLGAISMTREGETETRRQSRGGGVKIEVMQKHPHFTRSEIGDGAL